MTRYDRAAALVFQLEQLEGGTDETVRGIAEAFAEVAREARAEAIAVVEDAVVIEFGRDEYLARSLQRVANEMKRRWGMKP